MKYSFLLVCFVLIQSLSFSQERRVNVDGQSFLVHRVKKGDTLFSLSKSYQLDKKDLLNANPDLLFGLKVGQDLKIPTGKEVVELVVTKEKQERQPVFHSYKVRRKNTLHSISRMYNISIEDIVKYNPKVKNGLRKGMVLLIPDAADLVKIKEEQIELVEEEQELVHRVRGDETLYSLSKKYDRSISSILKLNPELMEGLKIGMDLRIPEEKEQEELAAVKTDGFFTHLVETGETFWQLERRFGCSQNELVGYNPVLANGLKAGLNIQIPAHRIPQLAAVIIDENQFDKHLVGTGETLYSLAIRYQTRISELKKANPVLDYRGLIAGETITIPRVIADDQIVLVEPVQAEPIVVPLDENCNSALISSTQNYQIGLLIPLYLEANDTVNHIRITPREIKKDSLLMAQFEEAFVAGRDTFDVRNEQIIYPRSENFMHFYEGVLLAVDSLQEAGMNIELHVFDTSNGQEEIDSLIQLDIFRELDLIIGPVFPNLQKTVADFANKNRIPMVSPLSSAGSLEQNNPWYFKVNPTKDLLIRETANYLGEEYFDKNLIVMKMGAFRDLPEANLVELSREKFFSTGFNNEVSEVLFREYSFTNEGYWGLPHILSKDRENVLIIPSQTEGKISVAVTNLNALAEDYPITLVGLSNYQRYQSIQTEYYHHVKLKLLSPYFVDYHSQVTTTFIGDFREQFAAEPNQFSFQGYDVAFYFMSALKKYGKDFRDCLPAHRMKLTQCKFDFQRQSRFGGYMNHGLFVTSYNPDYTITGE